MIFPYIDFHTHRSIYDDKHIEVVSLHGDQNKYCKFYTVGFHPWFTKERLDNDSLQFISNKYTNDSHCLALGEFGLDALKGASLELQEEIFLQQIIIANTCNAPGIIHCVRAFDRLLRIRQKWGSTPWAVHGFVRNKILASQVLDAGIHISVAPQRVMSDNFIETLKYIPLENMFIESDSDPKILLAERYSILAELKKISVRDLKEILYNNFSNFFINKWKYHIGSNAQVY